MNKKKLSLYLIGILIPIYLIFGLGYLPTFISSITGIKYLFSKPDNFWKDIICDDFNFYTKGYSKKYDLDYNYFTRYSISIEDDNKKFYQKIDGKRYKFLGKIKLEYFSNNVLIKTDYITKWQSCGVQDSSFYRSCELKDFIIPIKNRYKDLSIKLTVIKPIKYNPENKFKLYISTVNFYR